MVNDSRLETAEFKEVFRCELEWVEKRRVELRKGKKLPPATNSNPLDDKNIASAYDAGLPVLESEALKADLCGLAISGGGIRSATFSLGVLQGLAATGLLPRFDYLSTVSGGGYIGSWFSAWVNREGFEEVTTQLLPPRMQKAGNSSDVEPEPIRHLRLYSNYLAPRPGLFSFDGWVLIAISLRNLMLNQLVLLLAMLGLFVGIRTIVEVYSIAHLIPKTAGHWLLSAAGLASLLIATVGAALYSPGGITKNFFGFTLLRFWLTCVVPWLIAAIFASLLFVSKDATDWFSSEKYFINVGKTVVIFGILHAVLGFVAFSQRGRATWVGAITGMGGGLVLFLTWSILYVTAATLNVTVAAIVTFGVPLSLLTYVFTNFLMVGLCGPHLSELEREWWSSMNSRLMMIATGWAAVFFLSIYGPWYFGQALKLSGTWYAYLTGTAGIGWLTALLAGLKASQGGGTSTSSRGGIRENLAQLAPVLFLITLTLGIAVFTTWVAYDVYALALRDEKSTISNAGFLAQADYLLTELQTPVAPFPDKGLRDIKFSAYWMLLASTLLLAFGSHLLGHFVGVNTFSLQNLYANRLVRCYLGASKKQRDPEPIVNMDLNDDLPISNLFPGSEVVHKLEVDVRKRLPKREPRLPLSERNWGPIHIINGALNQKASAIRSKGGRNEDGEYFKAEERAEKLQFIERQAESFVFTPLYCGSEATGYCPSHEFAGDVKLGTAVAVSGAAVSPNMGYHSSPAITALLTVFNIRLGAWFGNPSRKTRSNPNPAASAWLLMSELAGITDAESDHVYVSDGGHFENMGVYELIRRRCRFILAVDVGADPQFHENVGRVIRQVRIDFGINIDVDMTPVSPGPNGRSQSHVVVGRIHYGDVNQPSKANSAYPKDEDPNDLNYHREQNHGIIVWLKNSLTGDEPGDLANYAAMHTTFPYDTTADQFFNESQFESYRMLGAHSTFRSIVLPSPANSQKTPPHRCAGASQVAMASHAMADDVGELSSDEIFKAIYEYWLTKPAQFLTGYVHENEAYAKIQSSLRQDGKLRRLAIELYGTEKEKQEASTYKDPKNKVEERLMVNEMFTMLENVFFVLDLERQSLHPVHAGWMGVFSHWAKSESLKEYWADEKSTKNGLFREYSPSFCRFIDKIMNE